MPLYVSILIGGLLITAGVAMVLLPPTLFFSGTDESGRVTEVVERVVFPGGAIVVYKHPIYDPRSAWYISIRVHNYITSEEDLLAYVNSRTNALDELLNSLSTNEKVQVTLTFKEPWEPADFKYLYENYFAESDGPNHSAIIVENEMSEKLETVILNAPSPDYLEEFCTYPKKGLKTVAVISLEAVVRVNVAKDVKEDPRILLVDPHECLTIRGLAKKYSRMGFQVTVDSPPLLVRTFEPELTCGTTSTDWLLTSPSKYDRQRLYIAGKVSDLNPPEDSFFKLNKKLSVCYKYYQIDLSNQIATEKISNGDYAIVVGTFFKEHSTIYAHKIKKSNYLPPEELLSITLDKEIYSQGDKMNITIENISNETIWFTDTAYNLCFEKFNGVDWELHTPIAGGLTRVPLEPGQTAQVTWEMGVQFSHGLYRIGTHRVYAEFEVM